MTAPRLQDSLFQDPIGMRLRMARENAGLTREAAAQQLRLPSAIVDALEREDWQRLGAPIYVRAHLSAYLKLLGLPADLVDAPAAQKPAPRLAAMASRSRLQSVLERGFRNAVYLVMTAVIVVPVVWLATHYDSRQKLVAAISLEPEVVQPTVATATKPKASVPLPAVIVEDMSAPPVATAEALTDAVPPTSAASSGADAPPVVASLAPFPHAASAPEPVAGDEGLHLRFRQESWLELIAADGRRIERGLVAAGSERVLPAGEAVRVTLGNADAVEVEHAGEVMDLTPYRSANVARFTVSSTSEVSPAGQ